MEIKTIIIDDEKLGIDSLLWEINRSKYPVNVVQTFTDATEALAFLKTATVDLVFLDIQMPNLSGFELLSALPEINFSIIFATSFDEYALKAFKYSALDYLLKPVEGDDLEEALEKYRLNKDQGRDDLIKNQLQIHEVAHQGKLPERVAFSTKMVVEFLRPADILYCEAVSNYTKIVHTGGKLTFSKTLKEVEQILKDYNFIRVHRGYIVNPSHVSRYLKTLGGSLIMDDGFEVSISRSKKEEVDKLLFKK